MAHTTENDQIINRLRYPLATVGAASALAIAGCFGGGGSSGGGGGSDDVGDDSDGGGSDVFMTLDRLDGLDVEQTRDELLFYKLGGFDPDSDDAFASGLRAIHPDRSHEPVEFDIQVSSSQLETTTPVISGEWSQSNFALTGIERELVAAMVSGLEEPDGSAADGVATINTEASTANNAVDLVGEQRFLGAGVGVGFEGVTQSPGNIDAAELWVNTGSGSEDNYFYTPGTPEGTEVPYISSENAAGRGIVSIRDIANLDPIGWVAVQEDGAGDNVVRFLDTQGNHVGNVTQEGKGTAGLLVDGVSKLGEILPDGSYYLVLRDMNNDVAERQLWRYTPDTGGGPGTIRPVSPDDDPDGVVDMDAIAGGLLGAQSNRVAYGDDGALFFSGEPGFFSGVEGHSLYRAEGTTLEPVTTSGDSVVGTMNSDTVFRAPDSVIWVTSEGEEIWRVSLDGADAELIADGESYRDNLYDGSLGGLDEYETSVRAASDEGWIFYTAKSTFDDIAAVMHNVDSGEIYAVDDAQWVGSSSDGSLGPAGFLGDGRLSEVFLMKPDESGNPILGAVDAGDPLAGMVELGTLPAGTNAVRQGHIADLGDNFFAQQAFASGPHRLFRADLEGDQSGHIIYVDVNEEDSLETIVNSASPESFPVSGY